MAKSGKGAYLFLLVVLLLAGRSCIAQVEVMDVAKADSAMAKQAKPMLILLSANWCKYCDMQKGQLRRNKDFINKADRFYYVEFDAESKERIRFHGHDYYGRTHGATAGMHELAAALNGAERIAFPTWVLLDKDHNVLFRYNGVLLPKQLNELLGAIDEVSKN